MDVGSLNLCLCKLDWVYKFTLAFLSSYLFNFVDNVELCYIVVFFFTSTCTFSTFYATRKPMLYFQEVNIRMVLGITTSVTMIGNTLVVSEIYYQLMK